MNTTLTSAFMPLRILLTRLLNAVGGDIVPVDETIQDVAKATQCRIMDPGFTQKYRWTDEEMLRKEFSPREIPNPILTGTMPGSWCGKGGKDDWYPYGVLDALLYCREVNNELTSFVPESLEFGLLRLNGNAAYREVCKEDSGLKLCIPDVQRRGMMREAMREEFSSSALSSTSPVSTVQTPYAPILSGPFCLTGDTKIKLLNGFDVRIDELAEKCADKQFWVYSATPDGNIVPGLAHSPHKTGNQVDVVEVELDNGEKIRCTPNHLFMLKNGNYKKASELTLGQSLMPCYTEPRIRFRKTSAQKMGVENSKLRKINVAEINLVLRGCHCLRERHWTPDMRLLAAVSVARYAASQKEAQQRCPLNHKVVAVRHAGHADVYDITVEDYHNFALGAGVFVHNSKQLYLTDYLSMHSKAFEEYHHDPIARRIINLLVQYILGKNPHIVFQKKLKDDLDAQATWTEWERREDVYWRQRQWLIEQYLYGEIFHRWYEVPGGPPGILEIDPSTVWEVVTDPENIRKRYYVHCQYPTQYQLILGAPEGQKWTGPQPEMQRYVVRQIPIQEIDHYKIGGVSNEKRGRSYLLPLLTWLLRFRDYLDIEILRAAAAANYTYDTTVKGSQQDVDAYVTGRAAAGVLGPLTEYVHNDRIERKPMQPQAYSGGQGGIADAVLSVVAAGAGIPKEHLNVSMSGGGSRATALVGSEPFTKVIDEGQGYYEQQVHDRVRRVLGEKYDEDSIECILPSVTKDNRTETIKNIVIGTTEGFIDHKTAAEQYATEMDITTYNYDETQASIQQKKDEGIGSLYNPPPPTPEEESPQDKPLSGDGRAAIKKELKTL